MAHSLRLLISIAIVFLSFIGLSQAEPIRVFTWEGYVEPGEVNAVNTLLKEKGYSEFTVEVIKPWAEGPEQMFKVLRAGKADISF